MYTAFSAQQLFSELDFITKRVSKLRSVLHKGKLQTNSMFLKIDLFVYLHSFFYSFARMQYFQIPSITIGGYDFTSMDEDGNPAPLNMELDQYARADLNATFNTFVLNGTIVTSKSHNILWFENDDQLITNSVINQVV